MAAISITFRLPPQLHAYSLYSHIQYTFHKLRRMDQLELIIFSVPLFLQYFRFFQTCRNFLWPLFGQVWNDKIEISWNCSDDTGDQQMHHI